MNKFKSYKSLKIADPMPIGEGGFVLNQNFEILADQIEGYTHHQRTPASQWTVHHNRGRPVEVMLVDEDGEVMFADIRIVDMNTIILRGTRPFSGIAYVT